MSLHLTCKIFINKKINKIKKNSYVNMTDCLNTKDKNINTNHVHKLHIVVTSYRGSAASLSCTAGLKFGSSPEGEKIQRPLFDI